MRKKISVLVCDCCENQIEEDTGQDGYECSICGKDACDECITAIFDKKDTPFEDMYVCKNCIAFNNLDKELKKFFKQKKVKLQLDIIQSEFKQHLVKLTMLKNIS